MEFFCPVVLPGSLFEYLESKYQVMQQILSSKIQRVHKGSERVHRTHKGPKSSEAFKGSQKDPEGPKRVQMPHKGS